MSRKEIQMKASNGIRPDMRFGKLTVLGKWDGYDQYKCICDCGNVSFPRGHHLRSGHTASCGECRRNSYRDLPGGHTVEITSTNGYKILIDKDMEAEARKRKWSVVKNRDGLVSVIDPDGNYLHHLVMGNADGMEVDHINLDRLDNRRENLRIVTHQQNQCNQPLQKNNTSGAAGVSFYSPRGKFRARIKASQRDIHLGYYQTFEEAVQARNVGMECMFGEYGRYNDVPDAPDWIRKSVIEKCRRFADLAVCRTPFLVD